MRKEGRSFFVTADETRAAALADHARELAFWRKLVEEDLEAEAAEEAAAEAEAEAEAAASRQPPDPATDADWDRIRAGRLSPAEVAERSER